MYKSMALLPSPDSVTITKRSTWVSQVTRYLTSDHFLETYSHPPRNILTPFDSPLPPPPPSHVPQIEVWFHLWHQAKAFCVEIDVDRGNLRGSFLWGVLCPICRGVICPIPLRRPLSCSYTSEVPFVLFVEVSFVLFLFLCPIPLRCPLSFVLFGYIHTASEFKLNKSLRLLAQMHSMSPHINSMGNCNLKRSPHHQVRCCHACPLASHTHKMSKSQTCDTTLFINQWQPVGMLGPLSLSAPPASSQWNAITPRQSKGTFFQVTDLIIVTTSAGWAGALKVIFFFRRGSFLSLLPELSTGNSSMRQLPTLPGISRWVCFSLHSWFIWKL